MSRASSIAFAASFLVALPLALGAHDWRHTRSRLGTGLGQRQTESIYRRKLLVTELGSRAWLGSLSPQRDPSVMADLFPGYPIIMQTDETLWNNYFTREFETKATSSQLSQGSRFGVSVSVSWTGCLDVISRYGADVILLGASDLAQELPADELAQYLPGLRIIVCASPSLTPDAADEFLTTLATLPGFKGQRAKVIVYGLGALVSFQRSIYYPSIDESRRALLLSYRRSEFLGRWAFLDRPPRSPLNWNLVAPLRHSVSHLPLPSQLRRRDLSTFVGFDRWSVFPFAIDSSLLERPAELKRLREEYPIAPLFFAGAHDDDCRRSAAISATLARLREHLLQVSERGLIYLTPTLGDDLRGAPPCYLPLLKTEIGALSSEAVAAETRDAADYGLEVSDFTFADDPRAPDRLRLDVAHPNIAGARKLTHELAVRLRQILGRPAGGS